MKIHKIQFNSLTNLTNLTNTNYSIAQNGANQNSSAVDIPVQYAKIPLDYRFNMNVSFTSDISGGQKRHIVNLPPLIEFEHYKSMPEARKKRYRKLYKEFDSIIAESQIKELLQIDKHPEYIRLPLQTEREMDEFIKIAQVYSQYKEHPIICLGRSPKWFLNASLLMKNGIPDYKFVAFSGFWYRIYDGVFGDNRGLVRIESIAPTDIQENAYKKYLRNIQADPLSILKKVKKTREKAIITDYVDSGKGVSSFLDLMSRFAQEQGVLDEFGHSFDLVIIGSKEYRQRRKNVEYVSNPRVSMPKLLEPYDIATTAWGTGQIIEQRYYDMDYNVFKQMLINQNTTECRSTYYPCSAWTIYKPNKFKTGMIRDMKKVEDLLRNLRSDDVIFHFKPVMSAYRNLLNFRILDALAQRNLLKAVHHTKI